jgi:3D (Asp-Asp-Asp) domain-containing protein
MSTNIYPVRGFFIGKAGKCLIALGVAGLLLGYPATIQADTATASASTATASASTATASGAPSALSITPPKTKTVWVTAYTSDPDETSDHPLITASGGMVHDGEVAANFLPFGTKIQIPALFGNKVFVVEDRTNTRFGGRVDIWMPTLNKAVNFGIQKAQIVILDANLALK